MNTKRRADCQLWHDWKERIIRIGDEQTSLQNQFDNLRNEFTDNSPRIAALEADVNALDGRVIIAESDIAEVEDRVTACENDIDRIDAELVDKTGEINNLANRMTLAEADIDDIDARLEGIEAGEILLSQLVPDADKDMGGKALNNVKINANEVKIGGANIDRTRQNEILLYDMQTEIESGTLNISNPNYTIVTESDLTSPYSNVVEVNDTFGNIAYAWGEYIPVTPGEKIRIEGWIKILQKVDDAYGHFALLIARYDKDKKVISSNGGRDGTFFDYRNVELNKWHKIAYTVVLPTSHTPYEGSDGGPVRYIRILYGTNHSTWSGRDTLRICGIKYYREAKFITDIQAKVASFDGVVIKDGGTVDGVDISTHTHDGTAIGGPKISYNNLVDKPDVAISTHNHDGTTVGGPKISYNNLIDKPQVDLATHTHDGTAVGGPKISYNDLVDKPDIPTSFPKPPMPYKKTVSINLGDSINVLDIIPEGRTALTVEQLQYREIANINEGSGQFVDIGIRYDDNTIYSGIDRITKNGDTPWHPPTYPSFNPVYHFTKNYIIGIRITRSPHEGPNITGYVDIIGHVY